MNFRSCRVLVKKQRFAWCLHLLKQDVAEVLHFGDTITAMRQQIKFCQRCANISDADICSICANSLAQPAIDMRGRKHTRRNCNRKHPTIQWNLPCAWRCYFTVSMVLVPISWVLNALINRITNEETEELIFALNPNIQGDTTIYYIQRKIQHITCKVTTIARGIAFGGELEYADEMTLARSISNRLPVNQYVK